MTYSDDAYNFSDAPVVSESAPVVSRLCPEVDAAEWASMPNPDIYPQYLTPDTEIPF